MYFSNEEPTPIEPTPEVTEFKCKVIVYLIYFGLNFLPLVLGAYIWYVYNYLIAIGITLFLYLITGIISSKLRLMSIPPDQLERSFSNLEISKWYVSKNIFC